MTTMQLELNLNNDSESDLKLSCMQRQIDAMNESMGKVRRKLFSEMSEMKKLYQELKNENEELRMKLKEATNEKTEWIYATDDNLFSVRECEKACG